MKRTEQSGDTASPSEMVIVDTFTRLIFGDAGGFSRSELQVIEALRVVEPDVATDNLGAMGDYLRALGVAEMIELVSRVQYSATHGPVPVSPGSSGGVSSATRAG